MNTRISRASAGALAAVLLVAVPATSASAVDSNLTVDSSVSPATSAPGGAVTYSIVVDATANAAGVTISDALPAGLTYVAGSSRLVFDDAPSPAVDPLTDGSTTRSYNYGTGWDGPWLETNDNNSATNGIIKNLPGFGGHLAIGAAVASTDPSPTVSRTVTLDPAATTYSLNVEVDNPAANSATERLELRVMFDDALNTTNALVVAGGDGSGVKTVSGAIPPGAAHATVSIALKEFQVAFLRYFRVMNVEFATNAPATQVIVDPAGDPSAFTGSYDMSNGDKITVTYDATVDSPLAGDVTSLTTTTTVATTADAAAGGDTTALTVTRAPVLKANATLPGTIDVGTSFPVQVAVTHDPSSDGADVCSVDVVLEGVTMTYVSGDDGDTCLNQGETWMFEATMSGMAATAGAHTMDLDIAGSGVGSVPVSLTQAVNFVAGDQLAETGTERSLWVLAGLATVFVALGAGLLVSRRRA